MDDGAVVAFRVVLENELPVARDVVRDAARLAQADAVPANEMGVQRGQRGLDIEQRVVERHEHEALDHLHRRTLERVVGAVEAGYVGHVAYVHAWYGHWIEPMRCPSTLSHKRVPRCRQTL